MSVPCKDPQGEPYNVFGKAQNLLRSSYMKDPRCLKLNTSLRVGLVGDNINGNIRGGLWPQTKHVLAFYRIAFAYCIRPIMIRRTACDHE